jgi:hypothetical protein
MRPALAVSALGIALAACASGGRVSSPPPQRPRPPHSPPPPEIAREDDRAPTSAEMRNVLYHSAPGVVLRIRMLSGWMLRTDPERPPYFDDEKSFRLKMDRAVIGLRKGDLERLLNDHVFAYPGAPLSGIRVSTVGSRLRLTAQLRRPVAAPIDMLVDVCAVQGDVCLRPVSMKAFGVPVRGIMRLFGLRLQRLLDLSGARGIRVVGDEIRMDPESVLPSPEIQGEVTEARVERNEVVLTFGRAEDAHPPEEMPRPDAPNYMFFRGGTMRFGRLFMIRSDMQIVDGDPSDSFNFDLAHYDEQLQAGYSRNQPDQGMLVVMADLEDLGRLPVPEPPVPGARPR